MIDLLKHYRVVLSPMEGLTPIGTIIKVLKEQGFREEEIFSLGLHNVVRDHEITDSAWIREPSLQVIKALDLRAVYEGDVLVHFVCGKRPPKRKSGKKVSSRVKGLVESMETNFWVKHVMQIEELDRVAIYVESSGHGHFLKSMAYAWLRADPNNKMILKEAWENLIDKYALKEELRNQV